MYYNYKYDDNKKKIREPLFLTIPKLLMIAQAVKIVFTSFRRKY